MIIKKFLNKISLLFFCITFTIPASFAAENNKNETKNTEIKIAILDTEKIIKESNSFVKFEKGLSTEKQSAEESFKQQEAKLREEQSEIESKASILAQDALQKKAIEFQQKVTEFQESVNKKGIELQERLNKALSVLGTEIEGIIKENNKYKQYAIILNKIAVVQSNEPVVDITLEVLKDLNKKNIDISKKIAKK